MPKPTKPTTKQGKTSTEEKKDTKKSSSKSKTESTYSKFVQSAVKATSKGKSTGNNPQPKEEGEKQIKKSTSSKKGLKPSKKVGQTTGKQTKEKSPSIKNRPSSVKKDVGGASKEKRGSALRGASHSAKKKQKFTSLGRKKSTKKVQKEEENPKDNTKRLSKKEGGDKNSKKKSVSKSKSKGKTRERSRSKSVKKEKQGTPQVSTPTKSNKSTPSKQQSSPGSSSRSIRYKEISSGKVPKSISAHESRKSKKSPYPSQDVSSSQPAKKKISAQKVKESSSNIESSSSIDLSAEQKKALSSARRSSEVHEVHGPDSQRISQEVEEVIKRIEDKKKQKKSSKFLEKKRKRGESQALVETHTAKDFDYILQKNPNVKTKPYVNLEDLSKHHLITYSDILLALLEVGQNAESYLFAYSSKSKCFWTDILQYTALKKIFVDFKAETLRKYWSELSKYDTEDATDLIKKHKAYFDKLPLKLGTIVSSISKLLSGQIKDLKEYIDNIQVDIRRREIFEHEFKNPVTGELTKVKEVRTTYNTRKRYEPGNLKDFKGSTINIISLKEVYHQNSNLTDFQKVMKNIKKEDSVKFTYLNEKTEEEKRKLNTINEEDKFVFKAIDNVLDALSSEFKNYSSEFILDTLQQNSMDIGKTYTCLKDPSKSKIIGFTPLDDKVLLRKQGEEYKFLMKEKGKDAIQEREEFLKH